MNKWKLISGITLLVSLCIAIGALGYAYYLKSSHPVFIRGPQKARYEFVLKRLNKELDLSGAQYENLVIIIDRLRQKNRLQLEDHQKKMRRTFNQSISEIRQELNPNQQLKLDALVDEFKKRRNERTP